MQITSAATVDYFSKLFQKKDPSLPLIERFIAKQDFSFCWHTLKSRSMRIISLMPDLFTLIESSITLCETYFKTTPTALRVALSCFGILNLFSLPLFIEEVQNLLWRMIDHLHRGAALDKTIYVTYMSTLGAAMLALGSLGIKELCDLTEKSSTYLQPLLNAILPWLGYALRIALIIQLIDLKVGNDFNHAIKSLPEKRIQSICFTRAGYKLQIIHSYRRYLRRSNSFEPGLNRTIEKLESKLRNWWRNPLSAAVGVYQVNCLAKRLRERSISYMQSQAIGLSANFFALLAMVISSGITHVILNIFSALSYLTQTLHSWNMVAKVPYREEESTKI